MSRTIVARFALGLILGLAVRAALADDRTAAASEMPRDALAELFPPAAMQDKSTLDLKILSRGDYSPKAAPDRIWKRIEFEFTTFEWAGEVWRTKAVAFIPDAIPAAHRDVVVIVQGNPAAAENAAMAGYRAIALVAGTPGQHYGIRGAGALMAYGQKKAYETGDPFWLGYAWLGKIFVRAVTAAQALPGFEAERFLVSGGSKWGAGAWIACAADERIVAAVPHSWNAGHLKASIPLKAERRGLDYAAGSPDAEGPGFVPVRQQLASLQHANAEMLLAYSDPYEFRHRLVDKHVLFIAGSNDPLFHPATHALFLPDLPRDVRGLLVPNAGHGPTAMNQAAFKMWLAQVFDGRAVPRIEVRHQARAKELMVSAKVETTTDVQSVELWTSDDASGAYLSHVRWTATPMHRSNEGSFTASVDLPQARFFGYFVMVKDHDSKFGDGVMTSPFQEYVADQAAASAAHK